MNGALVAAKGGSMYKFGMITDKGLQRAHNEDYAICRPDIGLYIVADGMGGHSRGEVASSLAAITVEGALQEVEIRTEQAMASAVEAANKAVHEAGDNMGTTLEVLWLAGDQAIIGHVGDSRIYRVRAGSIEQLTRDHTCVAELLESGVLSPEEAVYYPYQHMITRAVGIECAVIPDVLTLDTVAGDIFILCTDGLTGDFSQSIIADGELTEAVESREHIDGALQFLVDQANERGGPDNITIVCVRLTEDLEERYDGKDEAACDP
jgi:PPM family protein phosphatase